MANRIFIVIDGMDGTGKSEILMMLHNYLFSKDKSFRILTTREPTNSTYGKEIREILAREKDPKANAEKILNLFVRDREEHVDKIISPFLKNAEGDEVNIVLCDRYYYSTIAFQETQGIELDILIEKNKKFLKPNIAFILDVKPEIALERIKKREKEKFEQLEFMNALRDKFLELPKVLDDNIKIIDASEEIGKVFEQIKTEVDKIL